MTHLARDFVGYGRNPPNPRWPGHARLALNFVLNYEEGSEPSLQDGEAATETWFTEASGLSSGVEGRDLAAEGLFEYGSRVGFWRILRLLQERQMPATIYGCALALERNPEACDAIRESGFDVCSHGWRWIKHYLLSEVEEREHIRRAVASIERTVGERPQGWYCRYSPSVNTRRLLKEEGGFLYDSDYYGDELPFWQVVQGSPHLVIPYSLTNNDGQFAAGVSTGDQWFSFLRDAFDILYREGKTQPKMMSVGLHMRLVGHPARAAAFERFLDHVSQFPDVWITRRIDIAKHWHQFHPYQSRLQVNKTFDLSGRSAVITGGSRGIGAAIAELFAAHGARVAICHLGDERGAVALQERLTERGHVLHATECDVSDPLAVERMSGWTQAVIGDVDIVVNSAGVGGGDRPFEQTSDADWDRIVGINLRGTMQVTRAYFAGMMARRYGRVINIASQLAYKGAPGLAHYCAAKAGVVGFTRALAYEGAPVGVMVNAIAPGPVDTELLRNHSPQWLEMKKGQLPIGRFGLADEIAPTALLLASAAGAFYAGQTLSPNGGDVML